MAKCSREQNYAESKAAIGFLKHIIDLLEKASQDEIDNVKLEVLRTMKLDGYKPDISYPNDYEHPKEVYSNSFNEEFYRRLIEELKRRGIDYEGADLSNPYDTSIREEAHEIAGGSRK